MFIASPEGRVQDFAYAKYLIKNVPVDTEAVRRWLKTYFEETTGCNVERIYEDCGQTEVKFSSRMDADESSEAAKNEKVFAIYCMGVSYTHFSIARDGSLVLRGHYNKPDTKKRHALLAGRVARRLYRAVLQKDLTKYLAENPAQKIESDLLDEWEKTLNFASKNLDDLLDRIARLTDELDRRTDDMLYDIGKRADEALDAAGRIVTDLGDRARQGLREFFYTQDKKKGKRK